MRAQPRDELLRGRNSSLRSVLAGHDDLEAQRPLRIEACLDACDTDEAVQQEAGRHEKRHRERELNRSQRVTRARVADSRWRLTTELAGTRQAQCRPQSEQNCRPDREQSRESERGRIDRNLVEPRQDGWAKSKRESLG